MVVSAVDTEQALCALPGDAGDHSYSDAGLCAAVVAEAKSAAP
jgi:hypothetical protein